MIHKETIAQNDRTTNSPRITVPEEVKVKAGARLEDGWSCDLEQREKLPK
jgi:hypothetical protein